MTERARILFVDDEKRVLNAMRGMFRRDYELFLTTEGAEAIRIVTENNIDVIVADQRMPGMTGIEVLGKIKELSPRTVRILLTGYADPTAVEGSINIGEVFRFLSKPCPPKLLRETLGLAINAAQTAPVVQREAAPAPAAKAEAAREAAPPTEPPPAVEPPVAPVEAASPAPAAEPPPVAEEAAEEVATTHLAEDTGENLIQDSDDTEPALPILDVTLESPPDNEEGESHWQSVTNVVMSEDTVEETQETVALTPGTMSVRDVGVVVFTVDSEFAATAIRAVSTEHDTVLATTLVKVAQAIEEKNAGVLVTDFTTNSKLLQKMIGALKQHLPELVTIVVSSGRDTTDMINLINYGQVFRYVLKPIEPDQLRNDINAAAIRYLYLLNNPESLKRHQAIDAPEPTDTSSTLNRFLTRIRNLQTPRVDPTDTLT